MYKRIAAIVAVLAIAFGTGAFMVLDGQTATAAPSVSKFQQEACVKYGQPGSAAGNVMLYDWNDTQCPAGTYAVQLADPQPEPTATVTVTATPSGSASSTAPG